MVNLNSFSRKNPGLYERTYGLRGLQRSVGWKDGDEGLTWPAPKNSSAVLTGRASQARCPEPTLNGPIYTCWCWKAARPVGRGRESAHCCTGHCSALSCRALVRYIRTGWRAPCPVHISTSSKRSTISGPNPKVLVQGTDHPRRECLASDSAAKGNNTFTDNV